MASFNLIINTSRVNVLFTYFSGLQDLHIGIQGQGQICNRRVSFPSRLL